MDVIFYIRTLHGSTATSVAVVPCRICARHFLSGGSHGCNFLHLCLPGLARVCLAEVPHGAAVVPLLRIYRALSVLLFAWSGLCRARGSTAVRRGSTAGPCGSTAPVER